MKAITTPEDYRRINVASSVEVYADPARIPGPAVLRPTSDWDTLSRASHAGRREPMEGFTADIEYLRGDGGEPLNLPDMHLLVTCAGSMAGSLFEKCCTMDKGADNVSVYLWRFRVTGNDGKATELCFRACLPKFGGKNREGRPVFYGMFTVLDAQPFIEEV